MILHQRAHGKWPNSSEQRREWIKKVQEDSEIPKTTKDGCQ